MKPLTAPEAFRIMLTSLSRVLPGDHIHHVAPTSKAAPTKLAIACKDDANRKRARKNAKRAALSR